MTKLYFLLIITFLLAACNNTPNETTDTSSLDLNYYGEEITKDGAISSEEFFNSFNETDSVNIKVSGTINEVCKKKGCWMTMSIGEGDEEIFVKFKDYEFFVPMNADGRPAIIEGWAYKEEQTVQELKHYAFDAGKTEEEIAAITEPEITYTFMANGVIIE